MATGALCHVTNSQLVSADLLSVAGNFSHTCGVLLKTAPESGQDRTRRVTVVLTHVDRIKELRAMRRRISVTVALRRLDTAKAQPAPPPALEPAE